MSYISVVFPPSLASVPFKFADYVSKGCQVEKVEYDQLFCFHTTIEMNEQTKASKRQQSSTSGKA
jgi:hypothetical protein